jgi:hypothetical protein
MPRVGSLNISVNICQVSFYLTNLRISCGTENSRDSSVGIVTGYGLDDREVGVGVRGVKRPGRKADHSQLVQKSRKLGSIHPLPQTSSWRSASLVKHRDNFTVFPFTEQKVPDLRMWMGILVVYLNTLRTYLFQEDELGRISNRHAYSVTKFPLILSDLH